MASLTAIDNSTNTLLKGYFPSVAALNAAYPVGGNGWIAFVGKDQYGWQSLEQRWFSATTMTVDWGTISGSITNQSDLIVYIAAQITFSRDEMNHTRDFNTKTTSGAIDSTFRITKVDCTTGNITLTLPTAVGFTGILDIIKIDSTVNTVIVTPNGAETISGETTQTIYGQYDNMTIISDNSNWLII